MSDNRCTCCNGTGLKINHKKVGRQLRALREKNLIPTKEMCILLGISKAMLSYLESGQRRWTHQLIERYKSICS